MVFKQKEDTYSMKTNLSLLIILILTAFGWVHYSAKHSPQFDSKKLTSTAENSTLMPAADFTYTTLTGRTENLSTHEGRVILLHFWASWCAPCLIEFPDLIDLASAQKENLIILAVSTDENSKDIQKFLKRLKKPLPENMRLTQDENKAISQDLYQTLKLPETYLITPELKIAEKIIGPQDHWNSDAWHNKINILLHK